jgi:spore coat polysaccharide biosynthesis protein SpsF
VTDDTGERGAAQLEQLWAGDFGDAYTERNRNIIERRAFWRDVFAAHPFASALEVGCNVGENLVTLSEFVAPRSLAGVDINEGALETARAALPEADLRLAPARELPFADGSFELVFTAMVLIHQPDETLDTVMAEVVRCAARFVLAIEYESPETVEVPYRGQRGALLKRPYAELYAARFPELRLVGSGFRGLDEGWDDVNWSLFEKQGA